MAFNQCVCLQYFRFPTVEHASLHFTNILAATVSVANVHSALMHAKLLFPDKCSSFNERRVWTSLENYKNIGFLSNTGPEPLKNHSYQSSVQCWVTILSGVSLAGRWWPTNSGIWIFPLLITQQTKKNSKKKTLSKLDPLWQNFLDLRMLMKLYYGAKD